MKLLSIGSSMADNADNNSEQIHCSIVGLRGILIQLSLGVLSFSVLIIKRCFQKPRRPWKIWGFDTAKQVISQLLAHFINLLISLLLTLDDPNSDTCLWYFITNVFDNTVGVLICVFSLRMIQKLFYKYKKYDLISGNYYEAIPNDRREVEQGLNNQHNQQQSLEIQVATLNYRAWLLQLLLWNGIVIIAKVTLFVLEFLLQNQLDFLSKLLLGWVEAYPNVELVLVIVVVPVIMNGFAFWVQDNFLKKRSVPTQEQREIVIQMQNTQTKENTPNFIQANLFKLNNQKNEQGFQKMNEEVSGASAPQ